MFAGALDRQSTAELRRRRAYWLTALCRLERWEHRPGPLDALEAVDAELAERSLRLEGGRP